MSIRLIILLTLLAGLNACFRGDSTAHFYMLKPTVADGARNGARSPVIGLGPIRIAAYLDRPQIVTALSDHEYRLSEDHRWAERLDDTVRRVLAENLSNLIPTERIVFHPWSRQQKLDGQVAVDIQQFHADAKGQVRLTALWTLKDADGDVSQKKFSCRHGAAADDYPAIAAAQSECLGRLSRDIAAAVTVMPAKP